MTLTEGVYWTAGTFGAFATRLIGKAVVVGQTNQFAARGRLSGVGRDYLELDSNRAVRFEQIISIMEES